MEYGPLRIVPERRELIVDGIPISLGSRAYEIASLLVEAKGELVSKDEIMRRVWPASTVEENNIQVAVSALRKALGKHSAAIRTVAGRGYQLVAASASGRETNLPAKTRTLIGREGGVEELERLLRSNPIVTLTRSGDGKDLSCSRNCKTTAFSVPSMVSWLAEMALLTDGRAVPHAVASALRLEIPDNLIQPKRIASLVAPRKLLLVLDNCGARYRCGC